MLPRTVAIHSLRKYSSKHPSPLGSHAPKEFSCGIPPWEPEKIIPPPKVHPEFPSMLIRPPCMPGQKPGGYQTCLLGEQGLYCPPCRIKYKYPPFSENIEVMPDANQPPCWWRFPPTCHDNGETEAKIKSLSTAWKCDGFLG
ncbi:hypothetical protein J6590_001886 [Homalodisca vitripennis]|nr:hypothetical protein J6590_001886 [Homalodisca vitripennis]